MSESDSVAKFKAFAQKHLMALLRSAGGGGVNKQEAYDGVRSAFSAEAGWPAELDVPEPGPAKTPRWLNRLHWVVADLVEAKLLEPSSGRAELKPTTLGRGLLSLRPPFRDSPHMRELLSAIASTETDAADNARAQKLLQDFRTRFPPERLASLDLKGYAIGGGDQENLSWWLERGLETVGRYSVGSSRGHIIYRQKDGTYYLPRELTHLTPDQAMAEVARWHARVVELGGGPHPEVADDEPFVRSKRSRALKLLQSYFPDRFVPINSMEHMGRLLTAFGVPETEIPDGPVGRNRLLFQLHEEVAAPHGLTPLDFARILYARLNPAGVRLDGERLRGAITLFRLLYGSRFDADRFVTEERIYKQAIITRWQAIARVADLERALADGAEVAKATELAAALLQPPSNFLNFRYQAAITSFDDRPDARTFVEAVTRLLASAEVEDAIPDVTGFNTRMGPLYGRLDPGARIPTSRTLPTLILMLSYPERELVIRSDAVSRAMQSLAKRPLSEEDGPLTTEGYRGLREFAEAVRTGVEELGPADMVDVQGFIWGVFSHSDIWFGGVTYDHAGSRADMLPAFREKGIYAVDCGGEEPVRKLVTGAGQLQQAERKARTQRIAATVGKAEAAAFGNFIELAARPGSVVVPKGTYTDGGGSAIRIRGSALTRSETSYDERLGHTLSVEWREEADIRLRLKAFGKVASTLVAVKLPEALEILGADLITPSREKAGGEANVTDEARTAPATLAPLTLAARPTLPKNLVLYGPPGHAS